MTLKLFVGIDSDNLNDLAFLLDQVKEEIENGKIQGSVSNSRCSGDFAVMMIK